MTLRDGVATMGLLAWGALSMGAEPITAAKLDFRPTDKPVGKLVVAKHDGFKRFGEGSFLKRRDGSLLMFYDCRRETGDLEKAVIRAMQSRDGGDSWTGERSVLADEEASLIQPSLCRMANGDVGMTYSRILLADKTRAAKLFVSSHDDGETWSAPVPVSGGEQTYMTGAHDRLIRLDNGRLLSLVHGKKTIARPCHVVAYVFTSDDNGAHWTNRTPNGLDADLNPFNKPEYGLWETSAVPVGGNRLFLYGRTATGFIYESRSDDGGTSWSQPAPTTIPNSLAPMRLTRIPRTDTLVMIRNPLVDMASSWHGGARRALAVQTSSDGGRTWSRCRQLEFTNADKQWFDYPFLLWDADTLHLGYRAPTDGSFECAIYYQRLQKAELLKLAAGDGVK